MKHKSSSGSLFERVERIQTQIDRSLRQTIYIDKQKHAEWITKEFRL